MLDGEAGTITATIPEDVAELVDAPITPTPPDAPTPPAPPTVVATPDVATRDPQRWVWLLFGFGLAAVVLVLAVSMAEQAGDDV